MYYKSICRDCEVNIENIWANIEAIDKLNKLDWMMCAFASYFKLLPDKSPRDLELELREHNLKVGLIAINAETDEEYSKAYDLTKGKIVQNKYLDDKDNHDDHLTNYVWIVSCRPREDVLKETLMYHDSYEANLNLLEDCGQYILNRPEDFVETDNDRVLEQTSTIQKLQVGSCLVTLEEINPEDVFKKCMEDNPTAQTAVYGLMPDDGSPIFVIILNSAIICPIGLNIYHTREGVKCMRYVPLQ